VAPTTVRPRSKIKNKFLRALGECGVLDTGIIQTERHNGSVTIVCPVAECTYANKLMGYLRGSKGFGTRSLTNCCCAFIIVYEDSPKIVGRRSYFLIYFIQDIELIRAIIGNLISFYMDVLFIRS
jgi:hypothetical protein